MTRPRREPSVSRRRFLGGSAGVVGSLGLGLFGGVVVAPTARAGHGGADAFGPLQRADANRLELPPGFASRIVAVSGERVGNTGHTWHHSPDGGATFATDDGGWVYVSNSERWGGIGGAGAIRFAADGAILDAYSILTGTNSNCAGGPTPWGTWLSCEETAAGMTWECDPFTPGSEGVARPALGVYKHEAVAVDPAHHHLYLTEDRGDGLLYRFTPSVWPDLRTGTLEAAEMLGAGEIAPGEVRGLAWHTVLDPSGASLATRHQVAAATPFDGGEGCWYESGLVYFTTKGDDRVWRLDTVTQTISILYDLATSANPVLSGGDNVYALANGDVYVAEDRGNLEIVALTAGGAVKPIVRLTGTFGSEITGPALSPDGRRLYFSSQRNPGITFEVTGPFAPQTANVPPMGSPAETLLAAGLDAAARWHSRRR
jgi:secreted PhoX family phosphatase